MLYILLDANGLPSKVSNEYPKDEKWTKPGVLRDGWMLARDCSTFEQVTTLGAYLTAMTGKAYLPVDRGDGTYPRFDVVEAPRVGDEVSRGFNGDYYPCGKVVKVTKTYQIETDTGAKFRRHKQTSGWKEVRGSFWMVAGHVDERNPHF